MTEVQEFGNYSDIDEEENKDLNSSDSKNKCSIPKYINKDDICVECQNKLMCHKCWMMTSKIGTSFNPEDIEDIQSTIAQMNLTLEEMEKYSEVHNVDTILKKFTDKLSKFRNRLNELKSKFEKVKSKGKIK